MDSSGALKRTLTKVANLPPFFPFHSCVALQDFYSISESKSTKQGRGKCCQETMSHTCPTFNNLTFELIRDYVMPKDLAIVATTILIDIIN